MMTKIKRFKPFLFAFLALYGLMIGFVSVNAQDEGQSASKPIYMMTMDGAIGPAFAEYLKNGITKANEDNAQLIVIRLDTPGGLLTSTRDMITQIVESPVPVAVWVTPSGAHAASAGTFLMYAAHVAAMDEGTNVGAATPIQMQGQVKAQSDTVEDQALEDRLKDLLDPNAEAARKKAVEDTAALIRGLAEMRGRNAEFAEKSVTEATSITSTQALDDDVIDFIATSDQSFLEKVNGMVITLKNGDEVTIDSENTPIVEYAPDWKTQFLSLITDPNIAMILMSIGVYGLILEFYNPGALIPGTLGAISLLIGLYAMNVLPLNITGLALMGVGIVFMIAEAFIPSFGIMGFGGLAAFVIGATIMFDTEMMPGLALDWGVIAGVAFLGLLMVALIVYLTINVYRKRASTGVESLVGDKAEIIEWKNDKGRVRVQGEIWTAYSDEEFKNLRKGDNVMITKVEDLKVKIIPQ